ncbi:hypothetical protein ABT369_25015 [Dactylosporangium sp. NPDC000244]|uniref:hypothetical protein n=1 Tax=Dactylosporangium sp. NPDC000244 TaxID=3154365 RepID=UPI00332A3DC9
MPDFASPAALAARLADAGHLADEGLAVAGFPALRPGAGGLAAAHPDVDARVAGRAIAALDARPQTLEVRRA